MRIIAHSALLLVLFVVHFSQAENEDKHRSTREKCRDQLDLTDMALKNAMEDPKDLACYLSCFFQDISIMNDKGEFDPNAAVDAVEERLREAAKPIIFNCYEEAKKAEKGKPCQSAYEVVHCFKNQAPALYNQLGLFQSPVGANR